MKVPFDFGLYGILTNPLVGYDRLAELMVKLKVKFIQLRMKDSPRQEIIEVAVRLRRIIKGDSLFIINDDPLIAKLVAADGVHLGQDDMACDEARTILGNRAIIGLSTHNPEQTARACALNPDYIGIGPVYATPTKKNPDPPIGINGMKDMLAITALPAVVLGSIDDTNLEEILNAGAHNICCVRYINQATNPSQHIKKIHEIIERCRG